MKYQYDVRPLRGMDEVNRLGKRVVSIWYPPVDWFGDPRVIVETSTPFKSHLTSGRARGFR